jgi:hypothetical protein
MFLKKLNPAPPEESEWPTLPAREQSLTHGSHSIPSGSSAKALNAQWLSNCGQMPEILSDRKL